MTIGNKMKPTKYAGCILYQVGCRSCENGDWEIYTDDEIFVVVCRCCGHESNITQKALTKEPDSKAIDMRLVL